MAELHTIRADQEHSAALAEIERLWSAAEGTFERDRLGRLVTLIEAYEDKR